jgi:hypothetical protein
MNNSFTKTHYATVLIILLTLVGCAANRKVSNLPAQFKSHPSPYKIFSIGEWTDSKMVLTLLDSKGDYFIIIVPEINYLSRDQIYSFQD